MFAASKNQQTNQLDIKEQEDFDHIENPILEKMRGPAIVSSMQPMKDIKCSNCNLEFPNVETLKNHLTLDKELCNYASSKMSKAKHHESLEYLGHKEGPNFEYSRVKEDKQKSSVKYEVREGSFLLKF